MNKTYKIGDIITIKSSIRTAEYIIGACSTNEIILIQFSGIGRGFSWNFVQKVKDFKKITHMELKKIVGRAFTFQGGGR